MSELNVSQVEQALQGYNDPYLGSDLVSSGCVQGIEVQDGKVFVSRATARFTAVVDLPTPPLPDEMAMMFLTCAMASCSVCVL